MISVGIVGGTGYTGVELLRLLANHPQVDVKVITSRSNDGVRVDEMFPNLRGHYDLAFTVPDGKSLESCDVVFFATPNGTAMTLVPDLLDAGVKIIDLAADFRLKDEAQWEKWYGMPHACADLLQEAVYGLPELNREVIRDARLVANPGCYPTAVTLGLMPLIESGQVDLSSIVADCKSGVSGAGRGANVATLMGECGESFKAYAVSGHRHLPEIRQNLETIAGEPVGLTFVPHLLPMIRGIHATLYLKTERHSDWQSMYESRYAEEFFVDVLPAGSHPETRTVKAINHNRIAIHQPQEGDTLVVLSVIDNLVKGAAGQAIQNMNLMFDLHESAGLNTVALLP
ncbi:MAG: N-acetyl-gamma-glutamyl-phosphate reductase [Gammaproteobacteria bacterium]|nr:N-acetyl-gamma-glutamyl-phosphate reductase [Gammaproteobacteria bacterium]NNJ90493.1 N-acetyl-gamma-glutamyl-phosphate reductase [Gammaproteobacteria bacterium]